MLDSARTLRDFVTGVSFYNYSQDKKLQLAVERSLEIIARKLWRRAGFAENDTYLNVGIFTKQFYDPAMEILGPWLHGFIFEQEYHPKNDRFPPAKLAQDLDDFLSKIPKGTRNHNELRTEAYLADPVFDVLKRHGVGLVFSHWTWLPPLWKQFAKVRGESDEL